VLKKRRRVNLTGQVAYGALSVGLLASRGNEIRRPSIVACASTARGGKVPRFFQRDRKNPQVRYSFSR
jgi:hypothetical protein